MCLDFLVFLISWVHFLLILPLYTDLPFSAFVCLLDFLVAYPPLLEAAIWAAAVDLRLGCCRQFVCCGVAGYPSAVCWLERLPVLTLVPLFATRKSSCFVLNINCGATKSQFASFFFLLFFSLLLGRLRLLSTESTLQLVKKRSRQ